MNNHLLPDPRPYPAQEVKNELLLHAEAVAANRSRAQSKLSGGTLHSLIFQMLQSRHLTSLSVALSMAPSDAVYRALWQAMEQTLRPAAAEAIAIATAKSAAGSANFSPPTTLI